MYIEVVLFNCFETGDVFPIKLQQHLRKISTAEAKMSKLQVSQDSCVSDAHWHSYHPLPCSPLPLSSACLAITQPRATLSLLSLHVSKMEVLLIHAYIHFLASVKCPLLSNRGKRCSVSSLSSSKAFDLTQCIIGALVATTKHFLIWKSMLAGMWQWWAKWILSPMYFNATK